MRRELGFDPAAAATFASTAVDVIGEVADIFKKDKKDDPTMRSQVFSDSFVRAASVKYKYTEIPLPKPATNVQLIKQYSKSPCIPGQTFGLKDGGRTLWVSKGCRGDFQLKLKPEIQQAIENILPVNTGIGQNNLMPLLLLGLGIFAFMKLTK